MTTLTDSLAEPAADERPDYWQTRSGEELKAIVDRGVLGGELFFAANRELTRRADEAARQSEAALAEQERVRRRQALVTMLSVAALLVAALAFELLIGF